MSGKNYKKIRQYYRRDVSNQAREMAELIGNAMKPKPKYVPWKVWMWALGFFIVINKTKK